MFNKNSKSVFALLITLAATVIVGIFVTCLNCRPQFFPSAKRKFSQPKIKQPTTTKVSTNLAIGFAAGAKGEMIPYFNEIAKENDLIGFSENSLETLGVEGLRKRVNEIKNGKISYSFASWHKAQEDISSLASGIDCLGYDLEKWEKSFNEWQDVSQSSQKMAEIAHSRNMCYIAGLSYALSTGQENAVEQMAAPADIYNIHAHGFFKNGDLEGYVDYIRKQASRAKANNPNVAIEITVNTTQSNISATDIYEKVILKTLDITDRVFIYYSGGGQAAVDKLKELVKLIRSPDSLRETTN